MKFQYAIRKNAPVDEQRDRELEDYLATIITPWTDFTPTWTNYTRGNGTVVAKFRYVGQMLEFWLDETVGSTTVITLEPELAIPDGATVDPDLLAFDVGRAYLRDLGTQTYVGTALYTTTGGSKILVRPHGASTTWATNGTGMSSTVPHTWASGDSIRMMVSIPVVR